MENHDVVEYPFSVLKKLGIFSKTYTRKVMLLLSLYILLTMLVVLVALLQLRYLKGDLPSLTLNLEAIGGFGQACLKFGVVAYHQSAFIKIVEHTKQFWKTNKCVRNVQFQIQRNVDHVLRFQRSFFTCLLLSVALAYITLFFGKAIPIGVWKMGPGLFYNSALILQISFLPVLAVFVGAFDCLFLGFCAKVVIQFRILCHCMNRMKPTKVDDKMVRIDYENELVLHIRYHIFLLRFTENLQNLYSFTLMVQYVTSSSVICSNMYAVSENNDIKLQAKQILAITTQVLQLAFYCIPADYVTSEALKVSKALYESGWYFQHSLALRSMVTLGMQKSQQEVRFSAGGLVDINSRSLISILKFSWSICTLMRRLQK